MAGDLDITERVVWSQHTPEAAAAAARPAGTAQAAPALVVEPVPDENAERIIHRYGRLDIAATRGTTASGTAAAPAAGAGAPLPSAPTPTDLSEVERLGLAALRLRESAEYRAMKANRPRQGEAWDMPGCGSHVPAPPTVRAARAPGVPIAPAPAPTSSYLEGSVAVGIIIVQGPTSDLQFTAAEAANTVAEVQNGLSFFATQNPRAGITFTYDIRNVIITQPGNPGLDPALREDYFRNPAMAALGFAADWSGVTAYVESIRTRFNTRWTYCGYFTKYPLSWFGYASIGGPRIVMDYNNNGWGPANIDRVFAHETGHIFNCPDEYAASGCDCGGSWGRYGLVNGNCENCAANGGVQCLMKANDFVMCHFTRGHLGWAPQLILTDYAYNAGGWRVDMHPRFVVDTNGDGRADVVGFGNAGCSISRAQSNGTFSTPTLVVPDYGYTAGGWRVDRHPRFLASTTGKPLLDIVGFGNAGVSVARQQPNGTFATPKLVIADYGYNAGGWRVDQHPRFVVDTNGDGRADIVGFGNAGVSIALSKEDGTYAQPRLVTPNFGYNAGGWRVNQHPRFVVDTTGDGRADIVGFGNGGVTIARQNADGTFAAPQLVIADYGYNAGGWRVDQHPRFVMDITGDGRADIIGFGNAGVSVALAQPDGTYSAPRLVIADYGYNAGGWRVDKHPRFLADTTGDGLPDIVGFGDAGVSVARNLGGGNFERPYLVIRDYGYTQGGWRVDKHPRFLADVDGNGRADVVGFGDGGVSVARS